MENLYIVEITKPFERLPIQFVPSSLDYNRTSGIANIEVVAKTNPLRQWTGGDTKLNFSLDFYSVEESREDVFKKVKWLQSLSYPNDLGEIPKVRVVFGDLFLEEVWLVENVGVKFSNFHPQKNWLPIQATVDISLAIDVRKDTRKDAQDFTLETIRL